jgi:hypothetical protein
MRQFGLWLIAAGIWAGGTVRGQEITTAEARAAVAGGPASVDVHVVADWTDDLDRPPPPPWLDLPEAVGLSTGVALFPPGSGGPGGGGLPPGQNGGGGGGGMGGGGTARPDGMPLLPADSPPLTGGNPPPGPPFTDFSRPVFGNLEGDPPGTDWWPPSIGGGSIGQPETDFSSGNFPPPPPQGELVPEPGTLLLAGVGIAAAVGWRRRNRSTTSRPRPSGSTPSTP